MKIDLLVLVTDETTNKVVVSGDVNLNSPRLSELTRRVTIGIEDTLTKEITVQAIVGELMANPTKIVEALCSELARNLMQFEPNIAATESEQVV